jgi:hypothetical protein
MTGETLVVDDPWCEIAVGVENVGGTLVRW